MTAENGNGGNSNQQTEGQQGPDVNLSIDVGNSWPMRMGKGAVRLAAYSGPIVVEAVRATGNIVGHALSGADYKPYLVDITDEGYQVDYVAPVTQLFGYNFPGTIKRASEAVDRIMQGDIKFYWAPERGMPRGKRQGEHKVLPVARGKQGRILLPAPRSATGWEKTASFVGRAANGMSEVSMQTTRKTRQKLLDALSGGVPVARITFSTDHLSRRYLDLMREGKLPSDQGNSLVNTDVIVSISWIEKQKSALRSEEVVFHLGNMPIKFDAEGRIINALYKVQPDSKEAGEARFYHPAIMGLRDFCGVASEVIRKKTGRLATVSPQDIGYSLISASKAGGHMAEVLGPHLERMYSIEQIEGWLARDPALVLRALQSTIRLLGKDGKEHKDSLKIWGDIASGVLGNKAAKVEPAVTWPQLIFAIEEVTTKNEAAAIWEGDRLIVAELMKRAGEAIEIQELYKRLMAEKAKELKEGMMPVPVITLLADGHAPLNILTQIYAELAERNTYGHIAREGAVRRTEFAKLIKQMSSIYTQQRREYNRAFRGGYGQNISSLGAIGAIDGKAVGRNAVSSYSPVGTKELNAEQEAKTIEAPKPGSNSGSN